MDLNIRPVTKKETTREIVYKELKVAIFNGKIKKDNIFTETQLANLLNTSRTPVREAVADLLKDGLLVAIPRKGLKVREIVESEIEQIFFLRTFIEQEGMKKLSTSVTKDQIAYLRDLIARQKEAMQENDKVTYIDLDQEFHLGILHFSNQNLLEDILQNLYSLTRLIGHKALMKEGRMREVLKEHSVIIDSLEENDPNKSSELVIDHLNTTKQSIKIVEEK